MDEYILEKYIYKYLYVYYLFIKTNKNPPLTLIFRDIIELNEYIVELYFKLITALHYGCVYIDFYSKLKKYCKYENNDYLNLYYRRYCLLDDINDKKRNIYNASIYEYIESEFITENKILSELNIDNIFTFEEYKEKIFSLYTKKNLKRYINILDLKQNEIKSFFMHKEFFSLSYTIDRIIDNNINNISSDDLMEIFFNTNRNPMFYGHACIMYENYIVRRCKHWKLKDLDVY